VYENGKMRSVETIPGIGGRGNKGEWQRGWMQLWYILRTFVNVTMYSQYKNNKKERWKSPLSYIWFANIFASCAFSLCSCFLFMLICLYLRIHCQIQAHYDLHMFSSKSCMLLAFTSKSLILDVLEFIFVCGVRWGSNMLLPVALQLSQYPL
jgi:hypothetical protein